MHELVVTVYFDLGVRCGPDRLEPCAYDDKEAVAFGEFHADVHADHGTLMINDICDGNNNVEITGAFRQDLERYLLNDHPRFVDRAWELIDEEGGYL